MAQWLESQGARVNDTDNQGFTPLHFACQHGNLEAAEWLVSCGARLDAVENIHGHTPLDIAFLNDGLEMAQRLASKDPTRSDLDPTKKKVKKKKIDSSSSSPSKASRQADIRPDSPTVTDRTPDPPIPTETVPPKANGNGPHDSTRKKEKKKKKKGSINASKESRKADTDTPASSPKLSPFQTESFQAKAKTSSRETSQDDTSHGSRLVDSNHDSTNGKDANPDLLIKTRTSGLETNQSKVCTTKKGAKKKKKRNSSPCPTEVTPRSTLPITRKTRSSRAILMEASPEDTISTEIKFALPIADEAILTDTASTTQTNQTLEIPCTKASPIETGTAEEEAISMPTAPTSRISTEARPTRTTPVSQVCTEAISIETSPTVTSQIDTISTETTALAPVSAEAIVRQAYPSEARPTGATSVEAISIETSPITTEAIPEGILTDEIVTETSPVLEIPCTNASPIETGTAVEPITMGATSTLPISTEARPTEKIATVPISTEVIPRQAHVAGANSRETFPAEAISIETGPITTEAIPTETIPAESLPRERILVPPTGKSFLERVKEIELQTFGEESTGVLLARVEFLEGELMERIQQGPLCSRVASLENFLGLS